MSDITLDKIRSGYNLSRINDNFDKIENLINEDTLHVRGGNNTMSQQLDMNSNRITNLPAPIADRDPLRKGDISQDNTGASIQYVDDTVDASTRKFTFNNVEDLITESYVLNYDGFEVTWLGYYEAFDGGGNSGIIRKGSHTGDGGSVISIDSNTYIEADLGDKEPDPRLFGAYLDGTNYDTVAIQKCVDYFGHLTLTGPARLNSSIVFDNLTNPTLEFKMGGEIICDDTFTFISGTRGIVEFQGCHNPKVINPIITGALLNLVDGVADPAQDGDAGIEYTSCTGLCSTQNPNIRDVMTWGIIHVNCEDTEVINPTVYNCVVQSGVGHAGVRTAKVTNANINEVGLYGIEVESLSGNEQSLIDGGIVSNSQKAVSIVDESENVLIDSLEAINCAEGFNLTRCQHVDLVGSKSFNCLASVALEDPSHTNVRISSDRDRDTNDAYIRMRAQDYILKVDESGFGYVIDNDNQRWQGEVGQGVLFLGDTEVRNISSIEEVADGVFGRLQKVWFGFALNSSYRARSFRTYASMLNTKNIILYDGTNITISNCTFNLSDVVFESYGSHDQLHWKDNNAHYANEYLRIGSAGTSTGSLYIRPENCFEVTSLYTGDISKFLDMRAVSYYYSVLGARVDNYLAIPNGHVNLCTARLTGDATTTGNVSILLNDTPIGLTLESGLYSGSFNYASGVSEVLKASVTDSVGDLVTTATNLKISGFFIRQ